MTLEDPCPPSSILNNPSSLLCSQSCACFPNCLMRWHENEPKTSVTTVPLEKNTVPLEKNTVPLEKNTVPLEKNTVPLEKNTVFLMNRVLLGMNLLLPDFVILLLG